jgi:hypothetical protein
MSRKSRKTFPIEPLKYEFENGIYFRRADTGTDSDSDSEAKLDAEFNAKHSVEPEVLVLEKQFVTGYIEYEFYSTPEPDDKNCLFIGESPRGLFGPLSTRHRYHDVLMAESNCIKITSFDSRKEAKKFGQLRIDLLKPKYNFTEPPIFVPPERKIKLSLAPKPEQTFSEFISSVQSDFKRWSNPKPWLNSKPEEPETF